MKTERFYRLLSNPGLLNHETAIELKSVVDEFPFFQTAWMLLLKNLKEIGSPDYEIILKKTAVRIPDRKLLYNFLNEGESSSLPIGDVSKIQSYQLGKEGQKAEGDSLIDKFLSSNSGKIRSNLSANSGEKRAIENEIVKNSVAENDEIVTETLANLLFQQKNYDKAIEAFKKLSLKNPEKSVYFASRIEEIEKLKNI